MPFYLILALVCLMPLPFGAVQVWAWSLMVAICGLALVWWAGLFALGRPPALVGIPQLRIALIAFSLAVLWIILQTVSWTPDAWHHPVWMLARDALGEDLPGRITMDLEATQLGLLKLLGYGVIFWIALQYGRSAEKAKAGLTVFTVAAGLAASLGVIIWVGQFESFLWFDQDVVRRQLVTLERLAIPFINPNNLASFAGIGILCGLGVLIGEIEGLWRSDTPTREKLRRFIEVVVVPRWYVVFSILMLVIAAAATLSRAGLAAIILGLLTLLFCLGRGNSKVLGWASGVLVLIVMGGALIYGETATRWVDRLEWTGAGATNRMQIYENTLEAMAASPWLGYGYGSFPALYRVYNQHDVTTVVEKAHSTILEVLVELGVPAAVMLFTAIVWPIMWCFRGARFRQKNRYIPAIAAAVSVLLIAHSTVDFPLQITAITAAFAMILGIGTAQSWSTRKREVKPEG